MSTRFTPLCHYSIDPRLFQDDGLLDGGRRTDQEHATVFDSLDGPGWQQAEREAEDRSATVEDYRKLLVERVPPCGSSNVSPPAAGSIGGGKPSSA
jgi:hypothetical protein